MYRLFQQATALMTAALLALILTASFALAEESKAEESNAAEQESSQVEENEEPASRCELLKKEDPKKYSYLQEYGTYLEGSCSGCHKTKGDYEGIPLIVGIDAEYFVEALNDYKTGLRVNAAMQTVAKSLDDDMIDALAIYYSSQPLPE